jgi:hypothetical protein
VTVANLASLDLDVAQVVRFGVRVGRAWVVGTIDLDDGRCNLRVLVRSRGGTASPYQFATTLTAVSPPLALDQCGAPAAVLP